MRQGVFEWHLFCYECKYEATTLEPSINDFVLSQNIDEEAREYALRELRQANFDRVFSVISEARGDVSSDRLLDVGAAHGWFVLKAKQKFATVSSIEPDTAIAAGALRHGVIHRVGYFPDVLSQGEVFDVIVFNDVFEHIPDLNKIVTACAGHLSHNGLLLLNLPVSSGIFYKTAKLLTYFRLYGPFERMWQKGLPSPHVHYFNETNLNLMLSQKGFHLERVASLSSVRLKRLYQRLRLTRQQSVISNIFIYICLVIFFPFLVVLPKDTKVFAFIKK
jgi:2-polyprenyl-3-methyl-5-hydroxy-6-metoxy-1,4-benzoquinol methylase